MLRRQRRCYMLPYSNPVARAQNNEWGAIHSCSSLLFSQPAWILHAAHSSRSVPNRRRQRTREDFLVHVHCFQGGMMWWLLPFFHAQDDERCKVVPTCRVFTQIPAHRCCQCHPGVIINGSLSVVLVLDVGWGSNTNIVFWCNILIQLRQTGDLFLQISCLFWADMKLIGMNKWWSVNNQHQYFG